MKIDTHADEVLILSILPDSSIAIESIKINLFPLGAFDCDSLNVDFKGK